LLASAFAWPALAATINGTVFEDRNYGGGAGRSLAASGGVGVANARVEIYASNGAFLTTLTTNASGQYSYTYSGNAERWIRVVNGSLLSGRSGGATCTTCVAVQTYRIEAPSGSPSVVNNEVGGRDPALSDAPTNTGNFPATTATQIVQSWSAVDPSASGATVSGIDFGFNFDTVVNTRDAVNCTPTSGFFPCQGSLRQFIINSNALGGEGSLTQAGNGQLEGITTSLPTAFESSIFMIPSGALTTAVASITLTSALPSLTGSSTRLDASTQTLNIGNTNSGSVGTGGSVGVDSISLPSFQRPEVQLNCGAIAQAITLSASNQSIVGFALRQGHILLAAANGTARDNLVGMTASGSSSDVTPAGYGISFSAPNVIIRHNYITVNDSGIRSDGGGTNALITLNEVARPASGHSATFDGILLINGTISTQITANLTRDQRGGGIELGFGAASDNYTNVTVANNTVSNNGFDSGSTPSSEGLGMTGYNYIGSNVLFYRNRVINNAGPGLVILAASGTIASQNSFSNNVGLAIDLDPNTRDPNQLGAPNGVTLNDTGDGDSGPNGLLNYPVITSAVIANGQLSIAGFARPGASIELYLAAADPSGFGEGQTYLGVMSEGSGADLDATTGTYGPAAINGRAQGTDTTNRFAFAMAIPPGIAIGSVLTSTATLSGQTSEFSGNVIVSSGPSLLLVKSVAVLSDPFNNTTNPKSIPGSVQIYTVRITNQGTGIVDNDSLAVVDPIPVNTTLSLLDAGAVGSGPMAFLNGTPSSALTFTFTALNSTTDDVDFSNNNASTWTYTPTPDAQGYDATITHIRIRPRGTMAGNSGTGNPYFEVRFRVKVK
jgi:hypothetical protein